MPDADMPVDLRGNRADLLIYGNSTVNRTNVGRLFEQFFNAARRDLEHRLREEAGFKPQLPPTDHQVKQVVNDNDWSQKTFTTILDFYRQCVPWQYEDMLAHPDPKAHVAHVLKEGIYLYHPPHNPKSPLASVRDIMNSDYRPHYDRIYVKNEITGEMELTDQKILIGELYIMELEKTGEDWSAGASVKVQHFGVPAKMTQHDRNTSPARQSAVRGLGESETRSYVCTVGPDTTMELLDQSNNPEAHRAVCRAILTANQPSNIEQVVDRRKIPLGGSKPVNLVQHIMACRGLKFVYRHDEGKIGK